MKKITTTLFLVLSVFLVAAKDFMATPDTPVGKFSHEQIIVHSGYVTSWNVGTGSPNWVAWELTDEEARGTVASRRDEEFMPDPDVKGGSPDTRDYSHSGYDRGHMAPAADMKWSSKAMSESFYLSNICPQNHELNEGLWLETEQKCRVWAKKFERVFICAGPIYDSKPKTIGQYGIKIPIAFYKVVLVQMYGKWKAIAFLLPNTSLNKYDELLDYSLSVAELEKAVGITFFPNLENGKSIKYTYDRTAFDMKWTKR